MAWVLIISSILLSLGGVAVLMYLDVRTGLIAMTIGISIAMSLLLGCILISVGACLSRRTELPILTLSLR